jgi:AraC family transcriptional regulator, transcriptional activator of pobA
MIEKETASYFHNKILNIDSSLSQFNVFDNEEYCGTSSLPYNRRDFYKISIVTKGEGILSYADKVFHIKGNVIVFFNPMIPYAWEPLSDLGEGYSCMFTEEFIHQNLQSGGLTQSPLFKVNGNHVLELNEGTLQHLLQIFKQMVIELQSSYKHKYDLLRSYVQIVMHEALKLEPLEKKNELGGSSERISVLFLELLERQFPIASPLHTMHFKNANEFASQLAIHTNHLNRAVKDCTGKTTTEHIKDRVTMEAKTLLRQSSWDIAQIGYCLGFEHASNFNIFFKKQTGQTPNHYRKLAVAI